MLSNIIKFIDLLIQMLDGKYDNSIIRVDRCARNEKILISDTQCRDL